MAARRGTSSPRSMTARRSTWAGRSMIEHDLRYDRADEFMEIVLGHWDAWDDDALIVDKTTGRFADPHKVRAPRLRRRILPLARAVHRAALRAGSSRHHPGRAERPRHAASPGAGPKWCFPPAAMRAAPRKFMPSLRDAVQKCGRDPDRCLDLQRHHHRRAARRKAEAEDKMARDRKTADADRSAFAARRGRQFRFRRQGPRRPADRCRTRQLLRACSRSATA